MRSLIMLLPIIFLPILLKAVETIPLYAQGCLPFVESDESGNPMLAFNCSDEYRFLIEMTSSGQSSELSGSWEKKVSLKGGSLIISIKADSFTFPDNTKIYLVEGLIKKENGDKITSISKIYDSTDSISLINYVPYGVNQAYPTFFFGAPMEKSKRDVLMKTSILKHFKLE